MEESEKKFKLGKYPRTAETRMKNSLAMKRFWDRVRESLEKVEAEDDSGDSVVE